MQNVYDEGNESVKKTKATNGSTKMSVMCPIERNLSVKIAQKHQLYVEKSGQLTNENRSDDDDDEHTTIASKSEPFFCGPPVSKGTSSGSVVDKKYPSDISSAASTGSVHAPDFRRAMSNMSALASDLVEFRAKAANEGPSLGSHHMTTYLIILVHAALVFATLVVVTLQSSCFDEERWIHSGDYINIPTPHEMYLSYPKKVVPDLETYFRSAHIREKMNLMGSATMNVSIAARNCTDSWIEIYRNFSTFDESYTRPEDVTYVLESLGIDHVPGIETKMGRLLTSEVSTDFFFGNISRCAKENDYIVSVACAALDENVALPSFTPYATLTETWRILFTFGVVIEALTSSAIEDPVFFANMFEQILGSNRQQDILQYIEGNALYTDDEKEFMVQKTNTMFLSVRNLLERMMTDGGHARTFPVWLNILEAAHFDMKENHLDNTVVALGLNRHMNRIAHWKDDGKFRWPLTKKWADTYISWNLAFISQFGEQENAWKLFIPSVICTGDSPNAEMFLIARIISLALRLTAYNLFAEPRSAYEKTSATSFVNEWGSINLKQCSLEAIHQDDDVMEEMFVTLCPTCHSEWAIADTGPLDQMSDKWYEVFVTMVTAITTVGTGLGSELILGFWWLEKLSESDTARMWRFAEFLFPLLGLVPILAKTPMALPVAVIGVYKFGFPEMTMYATLASDYIQERMWANAFAAYANALGLVLHHFSSIYVVSGLTIRHWTLTRELSSTLIILIIIHWFSLARYSYPRFYAAVALSLDMVFQWQLLSGLQHLCYKEERELFYDDFGAAIALSMLAAHDLYIIAAAVEMFYCPQTSSTVYPAEVDASKCDEEALEDVGVIESSIRKKRDDAKERLPFPSPMRHHVAKFTRHHSPRRL